MTQRTIDSRGPYRADKLSGSSGLAKAFPSLDRPSFVRAGEAEHLRPDDEVVGVTVGSRSRAYPTCAFNKYHIVNDRLNGRPLLVDT